MPLSITDTTAKEALDTFRYKIESVVSGLAKDLGTPYPSTVVAHEAEARRVVPGSLFKLWDGTYGWTGFRAPVQKESRSET